MGIKNLNTEFSTPVAPSRMFKALITDAHNLVPKLAPQEVKSVDIVEGVAGEAGCVRQTNFVEGKKVKFLKHKIDSIDKDNLVCQYSLIDGDPMHEKTDLIVHKAKFEATSGGGCVVKVATEVHVKDGQDLDEEKIKQGQELEIGYYKLVENLLLANPDVYA